MNDNFSFLPGLSRTRALRLEEIETFLELMPHAALLVEALAEAPEARILVGNSRLAELSAYTRAELTGLDVCALIPEWQDEMAPELLARPASHTLLLRDGSSLPIQLTRASLPPHHKTRLVVIQTDPNSAARSGPDWPALHALSEALEEGDFQASLDRLLAAGQAMTGAQTLALYQLDGDRPWLERCAAAGQPPGGWPAQLPIHDLTRLNTPQVWERRQRPACALHRAARQAGLAYLATAPLGQVRAVIGLLALGDERPFEEEKSTINGGANEPAKNRPYFQRNAAQLLAAAAAALFQQQARLADLNEQVARLSLQRRIQETQEDNHQEGLVLLDPDLNIMRVNQAAELMLGYASLEVAGHPVEKVLIGPDGLLPALNDALHGSATHNLGSARLYRRNGEAFLAQVRIFPVLQDNRTAAVVILIVDQSEQEQIRLHTQQLEHRALLGEVTAVFAHEVRNPINNISTGLQLMAMSLPPEDPGQENITRMLQDCDRLADLIRSVLAFSKPAEYEMERLDLPQLLQRLLDRLRPRITKLNVRYDLTITPGCPPALGNLRALEQVFSNLITNALQAMGEGGHLVVKVRPAWVEGHAFIEASVADNGPGIPKELQDKVFQPFFTTGQSGTGLGLAIAKRILTAHKGDIQLESFPGGTIFRVRLPAEA